MGLFESLEQAAGLAPNAGPAAPAGVLATVIQMVQSQPGGIGGVIQRLEGAGLGDLVQSWLGGGSNQPLAPHQVQAALGSGAVGQVATGLGVSPDQAASHIAELLPLILDHLSPAGQAPAGPGAGALTGLLSKFGI